MAGSYPDVPSYRFAYDIDGTLVVNHFNSNTLNITTGQLATWNNDDAISGFQINNGTPTIVCFLFPEKRDINGIVLNRKASNTAALEYSSDTTSGLDGDWTLVDPEFSHLVDATQKSSLRNEILPISIMGASAFRLVHSSTPSGATRAIRNLHLYGSIATTESPNRLRVVDLDGDDIAAQLDFGNIAQRSSVTRQFKVVNNSPSMTASNITIGLEAPIDSSPSLIGQFQVSTDNISFANAVNIGNLPPGAESGTLYIRNNVANDAQLGLWSARIIAHPVSWS